MDRLEGGIVQPRNVWLGCLVLGQEDPVATDLVISNRQQVARAKARGVRGQHPRRQQDVVRASARPPCHLAGCGYPLGDLGVIQGDRARLWAFDTPEVTNYTLVHVALLCGKSHEGTQHSPVVADGGGSQMSQGIVKIGVDLVRRKVGRLPGQPAAQDRELLQVAGAAADTAPVGLCEVSEHHGEYPERAGDSTTERHPWSRPNNRYNCTEGQLAQLYSGLSSGSRLGLLTRCWPILRAGWFALLGVGLFLHRTEGVLALLVLGQFGEALREAFPHK